MAQHMLTPPDVAFTDKRRSPGSVADEDTRVVGPTIATANAAGTTTTFVCLSTVSGTNAVRVGDKFKLFTSAGVLKQETVFTATAVATAVNDTITFAPAAAAATASGDLMKDVGPEAFHDNDSLDARLTAISSTTYSQTKLDGMTQNDKIYALRVNDDPGSL